MKRRMNRSLRRKAFTLLEVMLVLVIIAAIAGIAVVNIGGFQTRAFQRTATAEISNLKTMLETYKLEVGSYPAQLDHLYEQPSDLADPTKWMQIKKDPIKPDPWGRAYEYSLNGADFELRSLGPDGQSGTEDDITG
jgi:general secretion pathway protein G